METPMAPDDRNFEKALARHLRFEPARPSACADAETLAAYHERLLAPHELSSWKEHITGCARCQEILAQLETTDEIPLGTSAENEAHDVVMPAPQPSRQTVLMRPAAESPAKPRRTTWRLVVPAGALAAGLLVWIVSREERLQPILRPSATPTSEASPAEAKAAGQANRENETAKSFEEPKAKPGLTRSVPDASTGAGRVSSGEKTPTVGSDEISRDQALSSDLRKVAPLEERSRTGKAVGPTNRALQQQSNNDVYQVVPAPELKQEEPRLDKLAAAAPAPSRPLPAPPPPASAGYISTAPVPDDTGGFAKKSKRQQADNKTDAFEPQTVIVTGEAALLTATMSVSQIGGQRVLPAAGGKIIWRIEADGRVRRSSDAGDSWKDQDTGVSATLFSGSAPSEKVCWLVGTFGTVLLTTDGGIHWTKVTAPINLTIDRIEATDALHAVVTLQSSTVQFETFDAGQTWSLRKKK
jgi:hypothetical protein